MSEQSNVVRSFPGSVPAKRIPRESAKALRAYTAYEELGDARTYEKLAETLGHPTGYTRQIETWASWYHWQDRLRAYEEGQLAQRRKNRQAALERMDEEHAELGRTQALRAVKQIKRLIKAKSFGAYASVSLFKAATDLERLARGAATGRIEGDMTLTVLPKEYVNIDPGEEGSEP